MFLTAPPFAAASLAAPNSDILVFDAAVGEPDHIAGLPAGLTTPWVSSGLTASQRTEGFLRLVTGTGTARRAIAVDGVSKTSLEVLTLFRVPARGGQDFVGSLITNLSGAASSEHGNRGDAIFHPTGTANGIRRSEYVNGTPGSGTTLETGPGVIENTWYYLRMTAAGDLTIWLDSVGEPASQQTRTIAITSAGSVGFNIFSDNATVDIEFISWGWDGTPAPFPS